MKVDRYSKKEPLVFFWIIIPYMLIINGMIYGSAIFSSLKYFCYASLFTFSYMLVTYILYGLIAATIKRKLPSHSQLFRRIIIMLPIFYFLNIFQVQGIYACYEYINIIPFALRFDMFMLTYIFACVNSTIITFLNEAAANWHEWKESVTETDQLNNAYQKTKVLALKGHIGEHFLFNCFNSLSTLIQENEKEAEIFLNELTKVHRYMLKSDSEYLVPISEELKLMNSYLYLVKTRFSNSLHAEINVKGDGIKSIPPLTLQVILENMIYTNSFTKSNPLVVSIRGNDNVVVVSNNTNPKIGPGNQDYSEGLNNLVKKFKLLNHQPITIVEEPGKRTITIPLI